MITEAVNQLNKKSLKNQVKEFLYEQIRLKKILPGDKLPTQRELSKLLKVSMKTAETAMRELELENIIHRRVGQGSFLIDKGKIPGKYSVQTDNIMLVVPNLKNPVFSGFAEEVERKLFSHGKRLILATSASGNFEAKYYIKSIEEKGIDGIISVSAPEVLCEFAVNNKIPFINVGPECKNDFNKIIMDLEKAGIMIAGHLLAAGHKKIVCAGCFPFGSHDKIDPKFRAIVEYYAKHGLSVKIIAQQEKATEQMDYEKVGRELVEEIIEMRERPTAIVFYNDARAMGGMKALMEKGFSIPGDFSVAGFDNIYMSALMNPSLTTIDSGYRKAVGMAVEIVVGKKSGERIYIEPELIERESILDLNK